MIIIRDTRDKATKHHNVDDYLERHGHRIVRSKLYVGDVALLNDQSVCIDLKQDMMEVCGNLCQQHERFKRECQRAQDAGIKLIILVEQNLHDLDGVKGWVNPRLKVSPYAVSGARLAVMMQTMTRKYGVEWMFCDKRSTGKVVEDILCKKE